MTPSPPPEMLVMREHATLDVALRPETAAHLAGTFPGALELLPLAGGRFRIRTRSTIGTLFAPHLELRIQPKCDTRNVFAMLGWAYDLATLSPDLSDHARSDDVRRFLVAMLAAQLEQLVRSGLRRGYVEQTDEIPMLRGRLEVARHVRRGPAFAITLPCRFEDYTADLPANQVIRYTLERIGAFGDQLLDMRLRRLRHAFAITSRRPFRATDLDSFKYDRLTAHYRPIHRLCRIILAGLGADDERGGDPLGSFTVDMNKLFERFVAAWFTAHLPAPWELSRQHRLRFDRAGTRPLSADIVLCRDRIPRVVADTKYRMGRGAPVESELYQVLAYSRALRVHHAVLVYPDVDGPSRPLVVRDGENTIHADGFMLASPWSEVEAGLGRLLARMLTLASE